ncbi:MAG: MotA/TolQ/ExbB proton channel family protein [Bacteriovorax sp.]|nr:MotA/TolQ/ExbB proton channel family protein [Bacteriovorax sp.]
MDFIAVFKQGGFIMYPLLIFSVAIWIVAIQKILYLTKFKKDAQKYQDEASRIITTQKLHEMEALYKNCPDVIAKAHYAVFDEALGKDEYEQRLARRLSETNADLKKNLWILGTIGSSAPFVGLFGTVWGIMGAFKAIGSSGKAGFAVVAGTISEALIATAGGIIVAVFAVILYNYLQTKIAEIAREFRNDLGDMSDQYKGLKR